MLLEWIFPNVYFDPQASSAFLNASAFSQCVAIKMSSLQITCKPSTCTTHGQVRDKRLHTGAQKRLEVKISTRKLLEKTNQKKEERKVERDKISERMKELNVTGAPADVNGNATPKSSSATPELSTNFSHYAGEVPLQTGSSPAKSKPVLTSQKPKPKTGLEADAPLLNKHFSGYSGEAEVGTMGEHEAGSPRKQKPDLGALASLRKNRSAKASEASNSGSGDSFSAPPSERPNGHNPSPSSVAEGPELHQHYGSYSGVVATSDQPPKPKPQLSSEGSARLEALRANRANKPGSSSGGGTSPRRQAPNQSPARKASGLTPRPKPPTPRARSPRAARPPTS
jgi:hypothetical protein